MLKHHAYHSIINCWNSLILVFFLNRTVFKINAITSQLVHKIMLLSNGLNKVCSIWHFTFRKVCKRMNGGRSLIGRRRGNIWIRSGIMVFIVLFVWMQLTFLSVGDSSDSNSSYNDSNAAILSMVPSVLHKFLTPRPRNSTLSQNRSSNSNALYYRVPRSIPDIKRNIAQYNLQQTVYNEDIFGPLQNDSVVIVVQVCICTNRPTIQNQ